MTGKQKKSSSNSEQEKAEATRARSSLSASEHGWELMVGCREKALAPVRNDSNQAGDFPVQ